MEHIDKCDYTLVWCPNRTSPDCKLRNRPIQRILLKDHLEGEPCEEKCHLLRIKQNQPNEFSGLFKSTGFSRFMFEDEITPVNAYEFDQEIYQAEKYKPKFTLKEDGYRMALAEKMNTAFYICHVPIIFGGNGIYLLQVIWKCVIYIL